MGFNITEQHSLGNPRNNLISYLIPAPLGPGFTQRIDVKMKGIIIVHKAETDMTRPKVPNLKAQMSR